MDARAVEVEHIAQWIAQKREKGCVASCHHGQCGHFCAVVMVMSISVSCKLVMLDYGTNYNMRCQ